MKIISLSPVYHVNLNDSVWFLTCVLMHLVSWEDVGFQEMKDSIYSPKEEKQ